MKKNPFYWMLTAALLCGLSLTVTSCSDDDDDNNNSQENSTTIVGGDITDDEIVLATILGNWCDFDAASDLVHGIIDKTFEPTEGEQTDEANAFIRGVVVGTLEGADSYAQSTLGSLGFDINEPEGFEWTNPAIGTISYEHGSGNELGVIRMQIKQIPHLTTLRLLAHAEVNAGEEPYYSRGDIVKNVADGCFYLCVSDHSYGQKSVWISFDSESAVIKDQNTNTSTWVGIASDLYYNKPQASYSSLATWLAKFVIDDNGYLEVVNKLSSVSASDVEVNQVVPSTQQLRKNLISGLTYNARTALFEAWETVGSDRDPRVTTTYDYTVFSEKKNQSQVRIYQPTSLLFGYAMRWALKTADHWQPYVLLVKENDFNEFRSTISGIASQTTLSKSNFTWQELTDKPVLAGKEFSNAAYHLCVAALHWTHETFTLNGNSMTYYGLLDFTKEKTGLAANDWMRSNITSHEVTFKDAGRKNKNFRSVAIARNPGDKEL